MFHLMPKMADQWDGGDIGFTSRFSLNLCLELAQMLLIPEICINLFVTLSVFQPLCAYALVAQLDRVPGYEPGGQRFESSPVRIF